MEAPHVVGRHARRGDVGKLAELELSKLVDARDGGGKVFARAGGDETLTRFIVLHGNGAASSDDDDFLLLHGNSPEIQRVNSTSA